MQTKQKSISLLKKKHSSFEARTSIHICAHRKNCVINTKIGHLLLAAFGDNNTRSLWCIRRHVDASDRDEFKAITQDAAMSDK